jgi:hypothetical protein
MNFKKLSDIIKPIRFILCVFAYFVILPVVLIDACITVMLAIYKDKRYLPLLACWMVGDLPLIDVSKKGEAGMLFLRLVLVIIQWGIVIWTIGWKTGGGIASTWLALTMVVFSLIILERSLDQKVLEARSSETL